MGGEGALSFDAVIYLGAELAEVGRPENRVEGSGTGCPRKADPLPRLAGDLRDSGTEGKQAWALFDLAASSPPDYELDTYSLKSGHIQLKFQKGRNLFQVD